MNRMSQTAAAKIRMSSMMRTRQLMVPHQTCQPRRRTAQPIKINRMSHNMLVSPPLAGRCLASRWAHCITATAFDVALRAALPRPVWITRKQENLLPDSVRYQQHWDTIKGDEILLSRTHLRLIFFVQYGVRKSFKCADSAILPRPQCRNRLFTKARCTIRFVFDVHSWFAHVPRLQPFSARHALRIWKLNAPAPLVRRCADNVP